MMSEEAFRLRIGITGHRSGFNENMVRHKLEEILGINVGNQGNAFIPTELDNLMEVPSKNKLSKNYKNEKLCYTILSSLAEGVDRIAAKIILNSPQGKLEAILPKAQELYEKSFNDLDSIQEFRELLHQSENIIITQPIEANQTEINERGNSSKVDFYTPAGQYVVDHCDLLLAVWDGMEAHGRGGTAEIVAYAKTQNCPMVIVSSQAPNSYYSIKGRSIHFNHV